MDDCFMIKVSSKSGSLNMDDCLMIKVSSKSGRPEQSKFGWLFYDKSIIQKSDKPIQPQGSYIMIRGIGPVNFGLLGLQQEPNTLLSSAANSNNTAQQFIVA